jgi:hypothetical protein
MSTVSNVPIPPPPPVGESLNSSFTFNAKQDKGKGAQVDSFTPRGGNEGGNVINIAHDYRWTPTKIKSRDDIPVIILREFKVLEGDIARQAAIYGATTGDKTPGTDTLTSLQVYKEIWPQDTSTRTGWSYRFPYYNDSLLSLSTPAWQSLDDIGEAALDVAQKGGQLAKDLGKLVGSKALDGFGKFVQNAAKGVDFAQKTGTALLKTKYPNVNVADRPHSFTSHSHQSLTIEFPLYNTYDHSDWSKNKDFIYLFMSQNLYNKRDYITGTPPVYYNILIPGVYYVHAACVTNFNVKNLGNVRRIGKNIVPDAYQISITLQEMTMASKNQFHYAMKGKEG